MKTEGKCKSATVAKAKASRPRLHIRAPYILLTVLILAVSVPAFAAQRRQPPPPQASGDAGTHFMLEIAGGMGMPVGTGTTDVRTDLALKFGFGGRPGDSSLRLYWLFGLEGEFNSSVQSGDHVSGPVVESRTDTQIFTALRFLFPLAGNLRMFIDGGVGYGTSSVSTSGDWLSASQQTDYPLFYVATGLQYRLFRTISLGTEVTYMDAIGAGSSGGVLLEKVKDGVAAVKLTLTVHF